MANIALITGSSGLIGSEAVEQLAGKFDTIIGIDNNMRAYFFGQGASTEWNTNRLKYAFPNYEHCNIDIRDAQALETIFAKYSTDIKLIIHAAGQPSHDWAAREPITDFTINANGTLNLLELTRQYCPNASFIFTSTNKVYGDNPNKLPLIEQETRWELPVGHPYYKGVDEYMSVDHTKHSLLGISKLAADAAVQEYGRYFGLNTATFRCGCLSGPKHTGAQLHGFLSYLMKCAITGNKYTILGYKGKQVRDNIHSADLINMFWEFHQSPRKGEVYNAGGGRYSNCSIIEAVAVCEKITGSKMNYDYAEQNRIGDHIWWISDTSRFEEHYPNWKIKYNTEDILKQIFEEVSERN